MKPSTHKSSPSLTYRSIRIRPSGIALALALVLCQCASYAQADHNTQVDTAIAEYTSAIEESNPEQRTQKFRRAEQLFRQIIEGSEDRQGIKNASLFVNLGNAALQGERIGPAIAAYRAALEIEPTNSKAHQNLQYARSVLPEWIRAENQSGLSNTLFFWTGQFLPTSISLAAAICFALAISFFVVGSIRNHPLLRNAAVMPLLMWLVLAGSLVNAQWTKDANGTVLSSDATLFSADSENSATRISKPLPSGAEVAVLQERDQWVEIRLPGGVTGWILKSKTIRISDF